MVPGEDLSDVPAAMVKERIDSRGGKGFLPCSEIEELSPTVKAAAEFPCLQEHLAEPPVAPGKDPFHERRGGHPAI